MSTPLFDRLKTALSASYDLERELGGGGMSRVYVARDAKLGRKVVVKVLPPDVSIELSDERFRREIRVTANLQHPHIVPVFSADSAEGMLYYTMPFVPGQSLRNRIDRGGTLPIEEVEAIGRDLLQALAYAHRNGVIHRDIKPGNILLTDDGALVTDFGIARATQSAASPQTRAVDAFTNIQNLTASGVSIGTVRYMAPEQLLADPTADHRMDLYALGLVLYECLAGKLPFEGLSLLELREAMLLQDVPSVRQWRPETSPALAELIERCLQRDPDARPPSADDALKLLGGRATMGTPSPHRGRRRLAIAGGFLLALGFGGWAVAGPLSQPLATARRIASRAEPTLEANRIIVAPFDATPDEPSLRELGALVADYVAQALSLLPLVEVVDPRAALINTEVVDRIPRVLRDSDRGVALAREVGARVVITGRLFRDGDSLRATATVVDAATGRIRQSLGDFAVGANATNELVDRVRRRAAAAVAQAADSSLSVDFGALSPPPSVEAYGRMRLGLRQLLSRDSAAIGTLVGASQADRTWIMPRLLLVTVANNAERYALSDTAVRQVRAIVERASPIERALLEVHEANFLLDRATALAAAEEMLRHSPGAAEAQLLVASQALLAGNPRRATAITDQMDPDRGFNLGSPFYWRYRAVAFLHLREYDRALEAATEGRRRFEAVDLGRLVVLALAALRRAPDVPDAIDRAAGSASGRAERRAMLVATAAMAMRNAGDSAEARALARSALYDEELAQRAADTSRAAMLRRLELAAIVGDTAALALALQHLTALAAPRPREAIWLRGAMAATRGKATEVAQADSQLVALADRYDFGWTPYHRARIAALAGDRERATQLLDEARARGYPFNNVEGFRPDLDPLLMSLHGHPSFDNLLTIQAAPGAPRRGAIRRP